MVSTEKKTKQNGGNLNTPPSKKKKYIYIFGYELNTQRQILKEIFKIVP